MLRLEREVLGSAEKPEEKPDETIKKITVSKTSAAIAGKKSTLPGIANKHSTVSTGKQKTGTKKKLPRKVGAKKPMVTAEEDAEKCETDNIIGTIESGAKR